MKDSPNGKRWGRRDENGVIVEAYGFDLSPMAARAEEFEALYAQLQEERQLCQSLRNTITVSRRIIRAKIDKTLESYLRGPWRELQGDLDTLLEALPRRSAAAEKLMNMVDWLKELKRRVEQAFEAAFKWPENSDVESATQTAETTEDVVSNVEIMTPKGADPDIHILTTNQPDPVNSNCFETKHAAGAAPESPPPEIPERVEDGDMDIAWSTHTRKRGSEVDISTLMLSCPQFAGMARDLCGYLKTWNDVHRAAAKVRPMVGISEDAWNVSQKVLGPAVAAAAIALVYDKHADGEVASPGGYLRGMVEKARAGELHLDRSFYGRLSERAV